MGRNVRKLSGLEIDEISLVDRPANQHGVVAIAKRAEEPAMPLYDAEGYEVDQDALEVGDYVYDEGGQEFYMASPEEAEELLGGDEFEDEFDDADDEFDDVDDDDLVGVGKARNPFRRGAGSALEHVPGRGSASSPSGRRRGGARYGAPGGRRERAAGAARSAAARGSRYAGNARRATAGARSSARSAFYPSTRGALGGAAAGGAAGYAVGRRNVNKSLGNQVLQELSKALDDGDRDEVISKLGDMVQDAQSDAAAAWSVASSLRERQELEEYVELAKGYELPVDPARFGRVLQRVAKSLPDADLAVLDRVLSSAAVDFDEVGYGGYVQQSDVMSQVAAIASNAVGKGDNDMSQEQAITALFETNPAAYDEYLAEQR